MRICILANARAVHTQRWARAYAEAGHEVHVLGIRRAAIQGVAVHTVSVGPANARHPLWSMLSYTRLLLSARRRLATLRPDVLHAHYTVTHGAIAAFSGFRPVVLTAWGSDVIWGGRGPMPWLLRVLNAYALRRADLVTSASRFMIGAIDGLARRADSVAHVPFGVDTDRFSPASAASEGARANEFRIGFVKSLHPKYGPEHLLHAMAEVRAALPSARLVMVGKGPLEVSLKHLAATLGIADCVDFVGFVPNDDVPALMRSFDVLVNTSVVPESFGVAVLEASACGLPVVATAVGGVPEVCRDGETGLLVAARDPGALAAAILRLARDPAFRERLGRAGRRLVLKRYVWRDSVAQMLDRMRRLGASA